MKAADLNFNAVKAGFDYAENRLEKADRFRLERMDSTAGKILINGTATFGNTLSAKAYFFADLTQVQSGAVAEP